MKVKKALHIVMLLLIICSLLLTTACTSREERQQIDNVQDLIAVINEDAPEKTAIDAARRAYDGLDEKLKAEVGNYQALVAAEERYEEAERIAEELRIAEEKKEELLRDIHLTLSINIVGCMTLREAVVSVWKSAINDRYADFNQALSSLYAGKEYEYIGSTIVSRQTAENFVTALDQLQEDQNTLAAKMKEIAALDVDGKLYDAIVQWYSEYMVLYNQVVSPSGSYQTYSADTNDAINNIQKAEAELDIVWPY